MLLVLEKSVPELDGVQAASMNLRTHLCLFAKVKNDGALPYVPFMS
jgi:hypothetical protein